MSLNDIVALCFLATLTVSYFILMSDRLNLKLLTFFVLSLLFTLAAALLGIVFFPSYITIASMLQCAFYDIGSFLHLLSGKRTVREVTMIK